MNLAFQRFAYDVPTSPGGPALDQSRQGVEELLASVKRQRVPLAIWVLVGIAAAALYLLVTPPLYSAATQIILESHRPVLGDSDALASAIQANLDAAQADSQIQVVKSERILRFVFETLKLSATPEYATQPIPLMRRILDLLPHGARVPVPQTTQAAFENFIARVNVRRIGQSYVLEISYQAATAEAAARVANAITAAYVLDQIEVRAAGAVQGNEILQERVTDIQAEQAAALKAVQEGTIPTRRLPDTDARIISGARPPTAKSYPQSKLVLVFGAVFALATGLGVIATRHGLDTAIRSHNQVRRKLGLPCMAVIPSVGLRRRRRLLRPGAYRTPPRFLEAFRAMRLEILGLAQEGEQPRTIGIISCLPREGRSTVAVNLAGLLSDFGETVVLVDADLRGRGLTRALAESARSGVAEILAEQHEVMTAACEPINIDGLLRFVPAAAADSPKPANRSVGSNAMRHYLDALKSTHTYVIVDLPPASLSTEALAIGPALDGFIVVVQAGRTAADTVIQAMSSLVGRGQVIGIVLNKA